MRALRTWLDASAIAPGPVFRAIDRRGRIGDSALQPAAVNYIVKRAARRAGLDDAVLGAHSLRSGFCTQAALKVGDRVIMAQSGHKSQKSLAPYVRLGQIFAENAADSLGL